MMPVNCTFSRNAQILAFKIVHKQSIVACFLHVNVQLHKKSYYKTCIFAFNVLTL